MESAEIRRRIREDHARLRDMLEELRPAFERFESGGEDEAEALRSQGLALYETLAAHLELEDRLLAPALRGSGREGTRRAERLAREHEEQRELLRYLVDRLTRSPLPTLLVARELANFGEYLRLDMEYEERELIGDDVLGAGAAAGT